MVGVDERLDDHSKGIMMRLRVSMRKFESSQATAADIEIAQAFERPNTCYLNRCGFSTLFGKVGDFTLGLW